MVDTKKEQERDELHKAIWSIADDLRGSVDGWVFLQIIPCRSLQNIICNVCYDIIQLRIEIKK